MPAAVSDESRKRKCPRAKSSFFVFFFLPTAAQNPEEVLVTATRAIFIEENRHRKAPAAVVGVTIQHQKFIEYFTNETYKVSSKLCYVQVRSYM